MVRAHRPAQAATAGQTELPKCLGQRRGPDLELCAAHLVHGLSCQCRHMKAVVADDRLR